MLVEQLGSGMRKILEKYDKIIFSFSPNYLRVTFLYDEPLSATIHEPINGSLSDTRKLVLAVLIENPEGMYQDIARKTGLSRSTVSRTLTKLRNEKRIIRIGAKKSGYWKVENNRGPFFGAKGYVLPGDIPGEIPIFAFMEE